MPMPPGLRKLSLAVHLTFSVGWIGGVVAYLAMAIAAATSENDDTIRASWTGMELTGWYAIVPLAILSLFTGLVMALGTRWGLFRHYWVLLSFALTVVAAAVLVLHMPTVSATAAVVRDADPAAVGRYGSDLVHPGLGLVVLLVIQVLNVYKPAGVTRYGMRKLRETQDATR